MQTKQTNCREAHRPALSFPSEVITMLNRTVWKNTRTKSKARHSMKHPIVETTKPHKRIKSIFCIKSCFVYSFINLKCLVERLNTLFRCCFLWPVRSGLWSVSTLSVFFIGHILRVNELCQEACVSVIGLLPFDQIFLYSLAMSILGNLSNMAYIWNQMEHQILTFELGKYEYQ